MHVVCAMRAATCMHAHAGRCCMQAHCRHALAQSGQSCLQSCAVGERTTNARRPHLVSGCACCWAPYILQCACAHAWPRRLVLSQWHTPVASSAVVDTRSLHMALQPALFSCMQSLSCVAPSHACPASQHVLCSKADTEKAGSRCHLPLRVRVCAPDAEGCRRQRTTQAKLSAHALTVTRGLSVMRTWGMPGLCCRSQALTTMATPLLPGQAPCHAQHTCGQRACAVRWRRQPARLGVRRTQSPGQTMPATSPAIEQTVGAYS